MSPLVSLEEAAESIGSTGLEKIFRITLPLTTPGFITGGLLVFIWAFADFATPLVVGVQDLLAPQAYLNIVQYVDPRLFKMGIASAAIMVLLAIVFLIVAKKYVAVKDYSTLSYRPVERRRLRGPTTWAAEVFLFTLRSWPSRAPPSASVSSGPSTRRCRGWGWP
ncbi:MAG: ABC transporter permease subunit [Bacillota bacterium]|nr:ABC transporter permease subunit [Bacillota bacterium]